MTKKKKYGIHLIGMYGVIIIIIGISTYILGVVLGSAKFLLVFKKDLINEISHYLVWYSGIPTILGLLMILVSLLFLLPLRKKNRKVEYIPNRNNSVTVVLTAYNDELSISQSVIDFKENPFVKRVIVISNNSTDNTLEEAKKAGALVYSEERQGYGSTVYRALKEGTKYQDTEYTVLCEGDMTFTAYDIEKFLAYMPHGDIIVGTRIVEQLRDFDTQLTTFMFYGNYFAAKLLEMKHLGLCSLTDVGTTYKLCRNTALMKLLPHLSNRINMEFNPYFLDTALSIGLSVIECPITFHKRVGKSKGGNRSNFIAFKLGIRMIRGILFGWGGMINEQEEI